MTYRVSVKDSVFERTGLSKEDFADRTIVFDSRAAAEEWVAASNDVLSAPGSLTLHSAHPDDSSDHDAYLIFKPGGYWVVEE